MSHHIHSIAGNSRAAAEYQAYLERLRAAQLAEKEEAIRKQARARRFESYLRSEQDADEKPAPESDQEPRQEAENEAGQEDGFGKHYA